MQHFNKTKDVNSVIESMLLKILTSKRVCVHIELYRDPHKDCDFVWGTYIEYWDEAIRFNTRLVHADRSDTEFTSKGRCFGEPYQGYYKAKFGNGNMLFVGQKEERANIKKGIVEWAKKNKSSLYSICLTLRNGPGNMFYLYSKKL